MFDYGHEPPIVVGTGLKLGDLPQCADDGHFFFSIPRNSSRKKKMSPPLTITLGEFWEAEFIFELSQALGVKPERFSESYALDRDLFRATARRVLEECVTPLCREYIVRTKTSTKLVG